MATEDPTPEYRDIPGFPAYRVGDDGSVWSRWKRLPTRGRDGRINGSVCVACDVWKRLSPTTNAEGYSRVDLKGRLRFVHHLVLEAFVGPRPLGMEACHNDGNRANSALTNLRWDTRQANLADQVRHGTIPRGEAHVRAKLTEAKVREIRAKYATGTTSQHKLAVEYGVSDVTVSNVVRRAGWGGWGHVL